MLLACKKKYVCVIIDHQLFWHKRNTLPFEINKNKKLKRKKTNKKHRKVNESSVVYCVHR